MSKASETEHPPGEERTLRLADGRRITWRIYGAPQGFPVFALHGTPGSRLKFSATDAPARALGLTVIAPDRWGYGATDMHPAPGLAAFARDMAALAAALSLPRFAVLGVSGGGPYATAVAACLPEQVAALALVAPVGPIAGEPDPEITPFHRFCFGPLARSRIASRIVFRGFRRLIRASPSAGMRIAMARVPEADRAVLRHADVARRLAGTFAEGLRPGAQGPVTDLALFGRPWDLPLANVRAPARLWIGTADRNVPLSAAHRLAARLPDCVLTELPGEGHLWVALHYADVLSWIGSACPRSRAQPA